MLCATRDERARACGVLLTLGVEGKTEAGVLAVAAAAEVEAARLDVVRGVDGTGSISATVVTCTLCFRCLAADLRAAEAGAGVAAALVVEGDLGFLVNARLGFCGAGVSTRPAAGVLSAEGGGGRAYDDEVLRFVYVRFFCGAGVSTCAGAGAGACVGAISEGVEERGDDEELSLL